MQTHFERASFGPRTMLQKMVRLPRVPRRDVRQRPRAHAVHGIGLPLQEVQARIPQASRGVRGGRRVLPSLRQSFHNRGQDPGEPRKTGRGGLAGARPRK